MGELVLLSQNQRDSADIFQELKVSVINKSYSAIC